MIGWLAVAATLVVAATAGAPAARAQQSSGRPQQEIRIPLRATADQKAGPRIPVTMVAADEVSLPVTGPGRGRIPAALVPTAGGGSEAGPTTGGARSTGSLFDEIVGPGAGAGGVPPAPTAEPSDAGQARRPAAGQARSEVRESATSGRPVVRVIPSGTGRVLVVPAGTLADVGAAAPGVAAPGAGGVTSAGASLAPTTTTAYRLGPGDVLDVFVWRNPELSRQVPVRPDGFISLPLVGEVEAIGKSVGELQGALAEHLSEYVQNPTVTVTVAEIKSLVVYVLGNVNSPGPVTMDRNLTALQAIAMAGGLNEFANRNDIVVLRTDAGGAQRRFSFRYGDVVKGQDSSSNLALQAGDVIYVP